MRGNLENQQQIQMHRRLLNRKMKTIQSIGTFNETPQNFDRSIVCKRDVFLNNPFSLQDKQMLSLSNVSKISKVQSQLIDKQNLKSRSLCENKAKNQSCIQINKPNASQVSNKSIEKNSLSKSVERHILKPTNTPNFNKFQNRKINMSPFPQNKHSQIFNDQNKEQINLSIKGQLIIKGAEQKKSSQFHRIEKAFSRDLSTKKHNFQNSQVSSKFEDYQFAFQVNNTQNRSNYQKSFQKRIFTEENERQNTPKKIVFSSQKNSQLIQIKQNEKLKSKPCVCDQNLKCFTQLTSNKMAQITERLMRLQNQNYRLRILQQKFSKSEKIIQVLQQKLKHIESQNLALKESNFSCQTQKEQLQMMLKDVLFKREKQKLEVSSSNNSKQNTYRNKKQFDKNSSCQEHQGKQKVNSRKKDHFIGLYRQNIEDESFCNQNYQNSRNSSNFYRRQNNSGNPKKGIQPLGSKLLNNSSFSQIKQKPSQSRMKVQNLLSKLQIKIQKN